MEFRMFAYKISIKHVFIIYHHQTSCMINNLCENVTSAWLAAKICKIYISTLKVYPNTKVLYCILQMISTEVDAFDFFKIIFLPETQKASHFLSLRV